MDSIVGAPAGSAEVDVAVEAPQAERSMRNAIVRDGVIRATYAAGGVSTREESLRQLRVFPVPCRQRFWHDGRVISLSAAMRRTIALGAVFFAAITASVGAQHGAPARFLVLDTIFGLMFVLAGFIAWERRPDVPYGALLVVASFLWFVGSYAPTGWMPFSWLGFTFERFYDIVLAAIVLTFPGVGLQPAARIALAGLSLGFVARSVSRIVVGCDCTENPIALLENSVLFENAQVATSALIAAAALMVAVLALLRLFQAAPSARAVLWPVAIGGIVAALVAAWDAIDLIAFVQTNAGLVRLPAPMDEVVSWTIIALVALVPIGYMVGVLRLRLRRGALASLAIQLDSRPSPSDLQSALREALRDPTAELLVWDREKSSWVDAARQPVALPVETTIQSVTELSHDGEPYAAILHDHSLREDPDLMAATIALLRLALDNERLAEQVQRQLDQVRSSRARLVAASEAERRRIERDLHDGAQQRLIAVALALQEARAEAAKHPGGPAFLDRLDNTSAELVAAIEELRELARGIHPAVLTEDGLRVAVTSLARRASLPVKVDVSVDTRLPAPIETTAYYVVAEGLTNITRHARARSAAITIQKSNGHLAIDISDDGQGGADAHRGTGSRGLTDRVESLAGTLTINSSPDRGTHLQARIPCG